MYLHLGADCVVKNSKIIGIFNLLDKKANIYESFVKGNSKKYKIISLAGDLPPSSCIVTDEIIYLSGISHTTLKKRIKDDFRINSVYKR